MDDIFQIEPEALRCDSPLESYNPSPWTDSNQQPRWKSRKVILHEDSFFQSLKIDDTSLLNTIVERSVCQRCGKSRKYFCYDCHIPLESTKHLIPHIKELPCKIDVIKHPSEVDGKSSALHAKVICPESVRIFTYPNVDNYSHDENVYLVFPGPNSVPLESLKSFVISTIRNNCPKDIRFVFIDSTWSQCHQILQHENLRKLPTIRIDGKKTVFWRYQTGKSDHHLATIEAIYHVTNDFYCDVLEQKSNGQFDNLLFLYKFMFEKLKCTYQSVT